MARRKRLGALAALLGFAAVGYGVLVGYFYLRQESLLFLPDIPSRAHWATPASVGLPFESVHIPTADGERIHGWFVPAQGARAVVLFFHGNAGNISHRLDSLALFHRLGLSVLIIDYRGYGQSTGRPGEPGTYEDAEAAWRWLTGERQVPAAEIIIFGRSLGAAVGAWLASRVRPAGLIAEAAFRSVPALAGDLYPLLPVRALSRLDYATERYLGEVACPVLIVHGRQDEIVPFSHAESLRAAAPPGTRLLELSGGHNDAFLVSEALYLQGLEAFLADLGH